MKIIEISSRGLSPSADHLASFAKEKSLGWEVELLPAFDQGLLEESAGAFIDGELSGSILDQLSTLPTLVRVTGYFDTFVREGGKWYPRLLLFEAMRSLVVERARDLDNRASGFIIGDCDEVQVAAAVMVDLGFSTVYVANEDIEKLERVLEKLRRNFLGIEFLGLDVRTVVSQSIQSGLLINCMDLTVHEDLRADLAYFNFMKSHGLVLDLVQANELSLLEEAERASLRILAASDIFVLRDWLFLERCQLTGKISQQEFLESWHAFLKSHPLSSYKKRHS